MIYFLHFILFIVLHICFILFSILLYVYIINHFCLREQAINQVYFDVCILSLGQFGTKLIDTRCKMNV